jgi:hypothetical protein
MMALNASTDPPSSGPLTAGPQHVPLLDRLWNAASSSQLTIALAVLLAFTFAIAAVLPQLPAGIDPSVASQWLSTTAARYGRLGPFLSSTGLFDIFAGPWIITLLSISALHLALRVANQARRLARRSGGIPLAPQGLPFELVHLPFEVDAVRGQLETLASVWEQNAAIVADTSAARPRADAYFERHTWTSVGPLLTYFGPLLVVFGLLWNTLVGWRVTDVTLIPGRTVQPSQAAGLALSLVDPGSADSARPGVVSLTRGSETRHAWLGYARPVTWGTVWLAQRGSGPALAVRASAAGAALQLQSLQGEAVPLDSLHLRFGQNESEQAFSIPSRNLAFRVVSYEGLADRGIDRPVFLVEGYQGSDPIPGLNELVEDSKTIEWQGASLTLQREAYVVVDLAAMPGLPLLLLGALVLLAGVSITAWGGLTRTWLNAAAERDGTLLAVRVAAPALGQAEVARVASALAAPAEAGRLVAKPLRALLTYAAYTLAGALLLAVLSAIAIREAGPAALRGQTWPMGLFGTTAFLGLGALVAGSVQSLWFAVRGTRLTDVPDPTLPGPLQGLRGRAGDPGRGVSLAAFPLLTAALFVGSLWGLLAFAAPVRPLAGQMWLWVAWLLAAGYFHATSGWRPLRAPAWLAPVLAIAAVAAALAACLAAPSLLTL